MKRRETGILGERLASGFLRDKGYSIIQTNYRCRQGEIDIVAESKGALVFVEVRARHSRRYGTPEESIIPAKMVKLRLAAESYLQQSESLPASWRIDVIAIELDKSNHISRIEHIENAIEE